MSNLNFKLINDELNQIARQYRLQPIGYTTAKATERRVFLYVVSNTIGIIIGLTLIWVFVL